mgnify:CR=1 FL=1
MMKLSKAVAMICVFFTLGLIRIADLSGAPVWFSTGISDETTIIGNGSSPILDRDEANARRSALEDALLDASRQVYTEVRAYTRNRETEAETNSQFFLKDVQISSCLSLCGYTELNSKAENKQWFVQISISRERLRQHYTSLVDKTLDDAIVLNERIGSTIPLDPGTALSLNQSLRALLDELSRNMLILGSLSSDHLDAFMPRMKDLPSVSEVDYQILDLKGNPRQSYEDLAQEAISGLKKEFKQPGTYTMSYIEWASTGYSSEFSQAFSQFLAAQLESQFGWSKAKTELIPEYSVSGQILEEGDRLDLILRFTGKDISQTIPVLITPATIAWLGSDKIRPKDLETRLKERKELLEEALLSNKLQARVKSLEFGREPAIYRFGDKVNILVRANQACYVTLIYIEANGDRNVLVQNMRISPDVINEWVPVKVASFTAWEPSGIEQLWLQADVIRLPEFAVNRVELGSGAYKMIAKDMSPMLVSTRGIKMEEPESCYTEDFLSWTIVEK